jgi:hypothetical protein
VSSYTGPKKIVIVGGGIAGLAAADAITAALLPFSRAGTLPPDLEVTLVEAEADVGGRAMTWHVDDLDAAEHPWRHERGHAPHGIHFLWHSYRHFLEWTEDARHVFSPDRPTSTYNAWLAPPDIPGAFHDRAQVVAIHVCDPKDPATAWDPRARALLEAVQQKDAWVSSLERFVRRYLVKEVEVDDWLSFLDVLFDEEHLSPQLRWGMFFGPAFAAQLGRVETSAELKALLGGRAPQDIDVSELIAPFYESILVKRLRDASAALAPFFAGGPGPTSVAPIDALAGGARSAAFSISERAVRAVEHALGVAGLMPAAASAAFELLRLILRDAKAILDSATTFDPRRSAYLKNLYKAAFSSPFPFDLATAIRDVQMGFRNFETAKLQVFDGDDAQALWGHIRRRIEGRAAEGVPIRVLMSTWAKRIEVSAGQVRALEVAEAAERARRPIATIDPAPTGPVTARLEADAIVSTLLPACLKPLLPPDDPASFELRRRLGPLARAANETVNLQIFLPRKIALPFADPPNGFETKPFSISNLEGIFTILVDLERAWRPATFQALRFDATDAPFAGSAWELVGSWADVFTHDGHAAPSRYQWPLGIQALLARLAHDPLELEAWSADGRAWALDASTPGRLTPPVFGEVKRDAEVRARYFERWVREVGPIVVEQTLRQLAALPGLAVADAEHLKGVAYAVARGDEEAPIRFVFTVSRQAETRFFSAEPKLYALRPHARFETPLKGLWCAGDWTRSGLNVQAMEGALISGLQAATGVIEAMRAGGLAGIRGPRLFADMVPNSAWDPGP